MQVLGFAGFLDHPQIEVCDPANWEAWMRESTCSFSANATPLNRYVAIENFPFASCHEESYLALTARLSLYDSPTTWPNN